MCHLAFDCLVDVHASTCCTRQQQRAFLLLSTILYVLASMSCSMLRNSKEMSCTNKVIMILSSIMNIAEMNALSLYKELMILTAISALTPLSKKVFVGLSMNSLLIVAY